MAQLGLPLFVKGTDGVEYRVEPFSAGLENVELLWERAGKYSFMFSEFSEGDRGQFIHYFLDPTVVVCQVTRLSDDEPVGILYADEIKLKHSARVHYFFWDLQVKSREPVILSTLRWLMQTFNLHRARIEVPWYAYAALRRVHGMGLVPEGIARGSILYHGEWRDQLLFSVSAEELTEEAALVGRITSVEGSKNWHRLLDNDQELANIIFKRE